MNNGEQQVYNMDFFYKIGPWAQRSCSYCNKTNRRNTFIKFLCLLRQKNFRTLCQQKWALPCSVAAYLPALSVLSSVLSNILIAAAAAAAAVVIVAAAAVHLALLDLRSR